MFSQVNENYSLSAYAVKFAFSSTKADRIRKNEICSVLGHGRHCFFKSTACMAQRACGNTPQRRFHAAAGAGQRCNRHVDTAHGVRPAQQQQLRQATAEAAAQQQLLHAGGACRHLSMLRLQRWQCQHCVACSWTQLSAPSARVRAWGAWVSGIQLRQLCSHAEGMGICIATSRKGAGGAARLPLSHLAGGLSTG